MTGRDESIKRAGVLADSGRTSEAIGLLQSLAEADDAEAMTELGLLLRRGSPVQRAEGTRLLTRAASIGSDRAQRALGAVKTASAGGWMQAVDAANEKAAQGGNDWQGNIVVTATENLVASNTSSHRSLNEPAEPPSEPLHIDDDTSEVNATEAGLIDPAFDGDKADSEDAEYGLSTYRVSSGANEFANAAELRSRIFDVVTAEQPVQLARVSRVLLQRVSRTSDKGRAQHRQVIEALMELVDSRELDAMFESDDRQLESIVVTLPNWRSDEMRALGVRTPAELPLVELGLILQHARTRFPAMPRDAMRDHVLRSVLGIKIVRRDMIARFGRAWIGDLGERADGTPIELDDTTEADSSREAVESESRTTSDDGLDVAVAASDALALAACAITEANPARRATQFRDSALRGELLAVEQLLAEDGFRGVEGFDDRRHWAAVAADHGIDAGINFMIDLHHDHEEEVRPVAIHAWQALVQLRARAKGNVNADRPISLDDASREYLGRIVQLHRVASLRKRGMPELERLRSAWDWRAWQRVRDVVQRLDRGGDLIRFRDLTHGIETAEHIAIQLSEHFRHFGIEMVPDPRYELVSPLSDGFVHVSSSDTRNAASAAYRASAVTVRLAVGAAAIDGAIIPVERDAIIDHIEQRASLTQQERERLDHYAQALLAHPPDATRDAAQLAAKLDGDGRVSLLDLIAGVVAADGVLHPSERALLEHVACTLDIEPTVILDVERRLAACSERSSLEATSARQLVAIGEDVGIDLPGLDAPLSRVVMLLRSEPRWARWHLQLVTNAEGLEVDECIAQINSWSMDVLGRACITVSTESLVSDAFDVDLELLNSLRRA